MADDTMKETISALVDGELDESEMARSIRELHDDSEQRQSWQRYHLIGDALRKNLPPHLDASFASRVSQAIAAEVAPSSAVVEFKPKTKVSLRSRVAISKPLAGFALAASVAAVAYLGAGMIAVDEQAETPRLASNTAPLVVAPPMMSASAVAPLDGIQTVQGQRWNTATPAVESKLNTYLYSHHNALGMDVINSRMLPDVTQVESRQPVQGE